MAWMYAYCNKFEKIKDALIETGADTSLDLNAWNDRGFTFLDYAIAEGYLDLVKEFISAGAKEIQRRSSAGRR